MAKSADQVRTDVLNLVLIYEVTKGHLKWKVSDVARALKLSRSLIYYHFGQSKEAILEACYEMIAEEFYGLKGDMRGFRDPDGQVMEAGLLKTQSIYLKNPAIVIFFHRWRNATSGAKNRLVKIEDDFRAKLRKALPELNPAEILAVHTVMHGVVTSPFATPEAVRLVVEMLQAFLGPRLKAAVKSD